MDGWMNEVWMDERIDANLTFYGNEVKQRQSIANPALIDAGARMWVDDPLNGNSRPGWGYLDHFLVYVDKRATDFRRLDMQLWTSATADSLRTYELKVSLSLPKYVAGWRYMLPNPLSQDGYPLEVTPLDRLGFTHYAEFSPISFDPEVDDLLTATTAHRTYYYRLESNNNSFPTRNKSYRFSNAALKGRFSIGIVLNNAPPQAPNEQYSGAELKSSPTTFDTGKTVVLETYKLPAGVLTHVYFRFDAAKTTRAAVDVLLWRPVTSKVYALVYAERVSVHISADKPYAKVALTSRPAVNGSVHLGFRTADIGLCYSVNSRADNYFLMPGPTNPQTLTVGQTYQVDKLRYYYEFSIGATVAVNSSDLANLEKENSKTMSNSTSLSKMNILFLLSLTILIRF